MTADAILHYRLALRYRPGDAGIRADLDEALRSTAGEQQPDASRPAPPPAPPGRDAGTTPKGAPSA